MRACRSTRKGFTLAELLTVIVIITLLAGLVVTALPRIEQLAKTSACASNLRQIGQALRAFSIDHQGFYPPLIRPATFGNQIPQLSAGSKTAYPWYYELIRADTANKYGLDEHVFRCPADKNYDPDRDFKGELKDKLTYMSDTISYGLNYDVKYADGMPYRVSPSSGDFVDASGRGKNPSGSDRYPDYYRASEIEDPRTFVVAADSNSEFVQEMNFGISVPIDESSLKVGGRHKSVDRPAGNVLFGDDHVELWVSRVPSNSTNPDADMAKDINQTANRRYWTLGGD